MNEQTRMMRPGRTSAVLTVILGLLILLGSVFVLVISKISVGVIAAAVLGLGIAGFMAPSLTSVHAVYWNEKTVEGPARTFGFTLGRARTEIRWEDIVGGGQTGTGYWFIESADGRRIYWSYLYRGHRDFAADLRRYCPSLEVPVEFG